jgi:hypothetical protein
MPSRSQFCVPGGAPLSIFVRWRRRVWQSMRIQKTHAGPCFVILSVFAGLCGLLILGLLLLVAWDDRFPVSGLLFLLPPFAMSALCGWAAYSLFKGRQQGSAVAVVAWLIVAAVSILWVVAYITDEARGVHCPENLLAVIILVSTESLIALHFIQQWRETAT